MPLRYKKDESFLHQHNGNSTTILEAISPACRQAGISSRLSATKNKTHNPLFYCVFQFVIRDS
jgi:hypothetical protein